jgi:tetratricopeptide (TPR) repeat protein
MRARVPAVTAILLTASIPIAAQETAVRPSNVTRVDIRTREMAMQHHSLGWQYLAAEDFERARDSFSKAIDLIRRIPTAHYGLGKSYMGLKRYTEAIRAYSDCRDAYQEIAAKATVDQMALQQRRQDQMREIEDAMREAQRVRPSAQGSASQQRTMQELSEQMRFLENRLGSGQSINADEAVPPEVFLALGSAYFRSEQMADAEREYREAVKVKPNFGEAWNNLAVVALLDGRATEAEDAIRKAEKAGFRVNPQLKDDIRAANKD